jgi:hypothetical protein
VSDEHTFVSSTNGELRCCGRCNEWKALDQFNWRRKHKGQRDNLCRVCRSIYHHEHYAANKQRYIDQARERKQRLNRERTQFLLAYFAAHPCADCGESDPIVLEFDHLGDKAFDIGSGFTYRNWEAVLAEIAKCEVVCRNCHKRRTARRIGAMRVLLSESAREN